MCLWCLRGGALRRTTAPLCCPDWAPTLLVLGWSMEGCSAVSKEPSRTKPWTSSRSVRRRAAAEQLHPESTAMTEDRWWCVPPDTPGKTTARERFQSIFNLFYLKWLCVVFFFTFTLYWLIAGLCFFCLVLQLKYCILKYYIKRKNTSGILAVLKVVVATTRRMLDGAVMGFDWNRKWVQQKVVS